MQFNMEPVVICLRLVSIPLMLHGCLGNRVGVLPSYSLG